MMRSIPFLVLTMLVVACKPEGGDQAVAVVTPKETGPFAGLGLRYDGHYRDARGEVLYLIRFFPEGRAVLVNGIKDVEADLPKFLIRETQGNPSMGLYNVMVDVRKDSMFFVTRPEKGEISYRGKVADASLVRFHRHSHITGKDNEMEYIFYPDSVPASTEQR